VNITGPELLHMATLIGLFILTASIAVVVYCIVRGPHSADRIIALDLLSVVVVALVALYTVFSHNGVFLDVALAYALVAFLGTVAFARFLERSVSHCRREGDFHD